MEISVNEYSEQIINNELKSGKYNSPSQVIYEALKLIENKKRDEQILLNELRKGINSDEIEIDRDEFLEFLNNKKR